MVRTAVVGATGYGGRELVRLLSTHPEAELSAITSTTQAGDRLDDAFPGFKGVSDLVFEEFDAKTLARRCDVVFLAVPSTESMHIAPALRDAGARVIDIGADFRLKDVAAFRQYYGADHTAAQLLAESVYGLPPIYRDALRNANLVAGPGCYPISVILPILPIAEVTGFDFPIVVDSVSGVSGAGRSLKQHFHFPEMDDNVWAYKVAKHQHVPEIEQELGGKTMVQFTPHVGPYARGILTTITLRPSKKVSLELCYARYRNEPFVRVLGEGNLPQVAQVRVSNYCDFGWVHDERTGNIIIVSAIDNLMGGTAGIAIQCMNIMFGLPETAGIAGAGVAV